MLDSFCLFDVQWVLCGKISHVRLCCTFKYGLRRALSSSSLVRPHGSREVFHPENLIQCVSPLVAPLSRHLAVGTIHIY